MTEIRFRKNSVVTADVIAHLNRCDKFFVQNLTAKTDIISYSAKVVLHAKCFEAWHKMTLVGLVAAYFDSETRNGFITNVSVIPEFQQNGLASQLLKQCINELQDAGAIRIRLEVDQHNHVAQRLYYKYGFCTVATSRSIVTLMLQSEIKK
ncbi:ribosomal protein S18 acetylase RimI-like enzyme [Lelliottia nimipressuralis]|jgi:ribosomal protein S18 acetylase RimI-like enzyme|uniref:GNAT family N-acetyltransferase n=1 Tax=Lelliottia nimipressuralis TaxID=69220 RepID=UPI003D23F311